MENMHADVIEQRVSNPVVSQQFASVHFKSVN